ncbi:MAG: hypothetical protein LH610_12405 [Sphingomonas bacterium]|nr:hypothetical protein [Sphingomonas bacterium]
MWTAVALAMGAQQVIYEDRAQDVTVNFTQTSPADVQFSAHLPAGWSYRVQLDGDQDGRWGVGSGSPTSMKPTADRRFGQDARGGIYCPQYIFTASAEDPTLTYSSSECGRLLSKGHVELSSVDDRTRATVTIKLPADELFGTFKTARIQVCLWDTKQTTCQYTVTDPLVLSRF